MKPEASELSQRYLVLIKIDATNLYNRIQNRREDYLEGFSLKRDRAIFHPIFKCRYNASTFSDLSHLPVEVIEVGNDFFTCCDNLYWYLMNTQDMPNTIEDEIIRYLHLIERKFENLCLYIDAELAGTKLADVENLEDIPASDQGSDYFILEGEATQLEMGETDLSEINSTSDDS